MTALPTIDELGRDLLVTTAKRRLALTRPLAGVALFSAAWPTGAYWLAPAGVFVTFLSVIAVTHDLVHGSPRPAPERARPDPLRPPRALHFLGGGPRRADRGGEHPPFTPHDPAGHNVR